MSDANQGAGTSTKDAPRDFAALSRNAFEGSKTYFDSAVRNQIDADLRQFYGVHPAGSKYHSEAYKGRSKIFRPKTRMAIRKNEAIAAEALFSTTDVVSVTPVDPDNPVQVASANINKELLQYRLTKTIPWFVTAIGAYQDSQAVGVCASYQYWRYEQKGRKKIDQPCVDLIPVENLRFDPAADWRDVVASSPYFIHMMPMYVKDVEARMQQVDPKTGGARWIAAPRAIIQQAQVPYADSTRSIRENQRPDSSSANRGINDFSIVWVYRIFMEIDGQDMVWYCLANTFHVLSKAVPLEEMYFHGQRPYVLGFCVIETHKTHPSGVARLTVQQQAEINEVANSRLDNVKLAMSKRWKVKRGKQVDIRSLTRSVPNSVTMVTEMEDVEPIEFNDVTASSFQEQDRLNLDFDDMAGNFSQSSVQSNRNLNETVGGMRILDANINQLAGYQLRTWIETWLEPVLRQLVLLEQHYEDDQVILAIAGAAAQVMQRFGIDAITDELLMQELTVNVDVGMGATNPQQQVERFMFGLKSLKEVLADGVLQAAGADVREIEHEVMGKLGYRDGKRFFPDRTQEDPEIANLRQQNEQLQQELAAKRPPPELTAAQVRKIDAEVAFLEAEAAQIEQAMGASAQETDIADEVEAQIAEIQRRADEQKQQYEGQIAQLKNDQSTRAQEIDSRASTAKYTADAKARSEIEKAKLQSDTAKQIADIHGKVDQKLKPLHTKMEQLKTRVAAMRQQKKKA